MGLGSASCGPVMRDRVGEVIESYLVIDQTQRARARFKSPARGAADLKVSRKPMTVLALLGSSSTISTRSALGMLRR